MKKAFLVVLAIIMCFSVVIEAQNANRLDQKTYRSVESILRQVIDDTTQALRVTHVKDTQATFSPLDAKQNRSFQQILNALIDSETNSLRINDLDNNYVDLTGVADESMLMVLGEELTALTKNTVQSKLFAIENLTYTDLAAKIADGTLIVGKKYKIIDYRTVHTIPNTSLTNTGSLEPLIVTAVANNLLSPIALSEAYPKDIIYYDIANNVTKVPGCTKGYIYRRIDTDKNVDICFDFRNVKFRRWKFATVANWDAGTTYAQKDFATSSDNIYISLLGSNTNQAISSHDKWQYVVSPGTIYSMPNTSLSVGIFTTYPTTSTIYADTSQHTDYYVYGIGYAGFARNIQISNPYGESILCNIVFTTKATYLSHEEGQKHSNIEIHGSSGLNFKSTVSGLQMRGCSNILFYSNVSSSFFDNVADVFINYMGLSNSKLSSVSSSSSITGNLSGSSIMNFGYGLFASGIGLNLMKGTGDNLSFDLNNTDYYSTVNAGCRVTTTATKNILNGTTASYKRWVGTTGSTLKLMYLDANGAIATAVIP